MTVLIVGDVIDDILVRALEPVTDDSDTRSEIVRRPGGSAANQAAWLGHLGTPVAFVGRVAAADVARHTRELSHHGVDARLAADPVAATGSIVIVVRDQQRTMFTDRGAALRLSRQDIPDVLLRSAAHLHLTGYSFFEPALRAQTSLLLGDARSRGLPFSVDPSSVAFLHEVAPAEFLDWTSGAVATFPNLAEARYLTGIDDPEAAAASLTAHYPVVAITLGAAGVVIATATSAPASLPAPTVDPVDPTGGGDAFCAGFLHHWLAGSDVLSAATAGMVVAAQAVATVGARPG